MKALLIALIGIFPQLAAEACSVSTNDVYQKNSLVGVAASHMGIDLAKAAAISTEDYSRNYSGAIGGAGCPSHLNTQARITIHYKKNKIQNCVASLTVFRSIQIGDELVAGPYEAISSESPASSCAPSVRFPAL